MMVRVDRRLWLTADDELVEQGDPRAAFLWAGEGALVSEAEAERVGYQPQAKQQSPAPNKMATAANKQTSSTMDVDVSDYHTGGGWYTLPDGSRVRGEDAAREALE